MSSPTLLSESSKAPATGNGVSLMNPLDFDARCALPGMRMGVRALPADVGSPWLRETVH
jgi:hypothetical protein